jgi:transposase
MAFDCSSVSLEASLASRRPAEGSAARLLGRDYVDSANRSSLERFAKTFSFLHDLLAKAAGLDSRWHVPARVGQVAEKVRRIAPARLARGIGRRHVFAGKKRGSEVGTTKKGKGSKIMLCTEGHGLPIAVLVKCANPAEVTLIEPLLKTRVIRRKPQRLLYDRAADSDPLRLRLKRQGIELICPHRKNRKKPKTQDGRKLRRYKRRWKIERSISWLFNSRRLVVRYERYHDLFHGFIQLACMFTILRTF